MAKKRKGGKKGKRNSAAVKQSRPAAHKRAQNSAKPKTYRKGGKRNGGSRGWLPNPLSALKSIDIPTAAGVGIGVVGAKVTEVFVPNTGGYSSPLVKIGAGIAVAWAFGKSKIAQGVSLGLVGVGLYDGINVLSNNGVNNFINNTVQRFAPAPPAPQITNGNGGTGMGYVPIRAVRVA